MEELSEEERRDNDKVDKALSYFDDLRVEHDEEVAGLKLRQNQEKYYELCREFMPDIVGRMRFKNGLVANPFMDVVTRSDEAFALLCLDNVMDTCKKIAREKCVNIGEGAISNKSTRYTVGSSKRWSGEGHRRFNFFMMAVGEDRKERGSQFDEFYGLREKQRKDELYGEKPDMKGRATTDVAMEEGHYPWDDFGGIAVQNVTKRATI